jgi:hypothetical protein
MLRVPTLALLGGLVVLSGGLVGQEPAKGAKKDDPPVKLKGFLPMNWARIGLSEDQKQEVYRIQAKYGAEIDKLKAQIAELEAARDRERKAVLTPEQKKRLEDILLGNDK